MSDVLEAKLHCGNRVHCPALVREKEVKPRVQSWGKVHESGMWWTRYIYTQVWGNKRKGKGRKEKEKKQHKEKQVRIPCNRLTKENQGLHTKVSCSFELL